MSSSPKPEAVPRPPSENPTSPSLQPHDPFSAAPLDLGPPVEALPGANESLTHPPESFSLPEAAAVAKYSPTAGQDIVDLTMDSDSDNDLQARPAPTVLIKSEFHEDAIASDASPHQLVACHPSEPHAVINSIENPPDYSEALQTYLTNMGGNKTANGRSDSKDLDGDVEGEDSAIDSEEEHTKATAKFSEVEKSYQAKKGKTTLEDDIEFTKAQKAETSRLSLRKSRKQYDQAYYDDEVSMFFPESQLSNSPQVEMDDVSDDGTSQRGAATRRGSDDEEDDFLVAAKPRRRAPRGQRPTLRRKRATTTAKGNEAKSKVSKPRQGAGAKRGTSTKRGATNARDRGATARKRDGGSDLFEIASLLPYNMVDQAQQNREQPAQPEFTTKNKANALAQLIASIPAPSRDIHIRDKNKLLEATKAFNGRGAMRADGNGKWKLRGMTTSLHHYQVMGCSRMREFEKATNPTGGILGDDMGLGKTVMAIANIIDGAPEPDATAKTTLIVTPSSLNQQWANEIKRHTDAKFKIKVLMYRSKLFHDMDQEMIAQVVGGADVVITSYNEVIKGMPNNDPPPHLITARAKEEWWEQHFNEHKQALHQIKFHRIVLDEAQCIKNHESKTSLGCAKLRGKYRWALSGTPVQNSLTEFFAYFRFLKMKGTGDYETFRRNYCKKGSEKALERLRVRLHAMCIRRTHQDEMFGRPILQLPPIQHKTIELEFTVLEKTIYRIVRERFINKIKASAGGSKNNYSMFFTLLLRMRQLTAHILLIQKTLKELLETEDLERLWELTKPENITNLGESDRAMLAGLQTAIQTRDEAQSPSASSQQNDVPQPHTSPAPVCRRGTNHELSREFRRCLQAMHNDGQWEEANKRSICHYCGNPPKRPHVTACLHIYCFSCLNELAMMAAANEEDEALCFECGAKFRKTEALEASAFDEATGLGPDRGSRSPRRKNGGGDEEESLDWYQLRPVLQSTKTRAAVQQMETWLAEAPKIETDAPNKILVFSQFRGVLKVFGRICKEKGWAYESFHGEMSFDARNKAVARFTDEPECRVLLAAMKAGGVGLNLTAANRVILIDLWWNIAAETQAFCRVFRIGQTRSVEVVRLAIKNTVDIEIIKMQERKEAEISSAMKKSSTGGGLTIAELLRLFGEDTGEKDTDGIEDEGFIMPQDPYYIETDSDNEDTTMGGTGGLVTG